MGEELPGQVGGRDDGFEAKIFLIDGALFPKVKDSLELQMGEELWLLGGERYVAALERFQSETESWFGANLITDSSPSFK